MNKTIRLGTRGSALALVQTDMVKQALLSYNPEFNVEIVTIKTKGDKIIDKPLVDFGGKGAFVTEFEEALLRGDIDLAVHSAKDMPIELTEGLCIGAVLERAVAEDVLVLKEGLLQREIEDNCAGLVIGTGSLRRQFQLKEIYPDIECKNIRGNVPTRLQKVKDGEYDGVVLAYAGLQRLGLLEQDGFSYVHLPITRMLPAGGQGIIAIECKQDSSYFDVLKVISSKNTMYELETERQVLASLHAGCHDAIGTFAQVQGEQIHLQIIQKKNGQIIKQDGSEKIENRIELAKQLVEYTF